MKKIRTLSLILIMAVMAFSGCTPIEKTPAMGIRLRSEAHQAMNVGDIMTIVYSVNGSEQGVVFSSSDEAVVTVDEYARVTATGAGTAHVTLTLVEDPGVTERVTFAVTKTFFMQDSAYRNGTVDLSGEEQGTVYIKEGQSQVLVNSPGQAWYFRCTLKNTGFNSGDQYGGWGVGSFLVTNSTPIGEVMFWYGLRYAGDPNRFTPYYGGWRYASNVPNNKDVGISDQKLNGENGVTITIIRDGIRHYVTMDAGEGAQMKHAYDVPLFEGRDTYPGIYAQNQALTVTGYEASADPQTVAEKLNVFQLAEQVEINAIDDRLIQDRTYRLTSTVLPVMTTNKAVRYELESQQIAGEGTVTLDPDGTLTVGKVTGTVTVKAVALSDETVTDTQVFRLIERPVSALQTIDTGMIVGQPEHVTADESDGVTIGVTGGSNYIPLTESADRWAVTFTVKNTVANNTKVGIMSATAGYTHYVNMGFCYTFGMDRRIEYGEQGNPQTPYTYAVPAVQSIENTATFIKNGSTYFFIVNGKLNKRYTAAFDGRTTPVFYTKDVTAQIYGISVTTSAQEIEDILAQHEFYVGGYVTKADQAYTLASVKLDNGDDMDWPPVNDYTNGLKFRDTLTGAYTIEFIMSNIAPYSDGGKIDAKILVYLRSENKTSSVQFVIKKDAQGNIKYTFCPNFDDATWTEYELPDSVDFAKPVAVKIVKSVDRIELYLNGQRVYTDEPFMLNKGYWGTSTTCTPGIGSFRCGVTITDPVITKEA